MSKSVYGMTELKCWDEQSNSVHGMMKLNYWDQLNISVHAIKMGAVFWDTEIYN